jgi:flavin-dependent dehydrogenase
MERVDVVVVGGGVAGLAAGWAAAAGGVRAIVVDEAPLPRASHMLYALSARDLEIAGLDASSAERVHDRMSIAPHDPVLLGDSMAIHAVRAQALHVHLLTKARTAGAEIRPGARRVRTTSDRDGWIIRSENGEPIRAPILIVADGARSPTLASIGVAEAQRFSVSQAEVVTFLCATWDLPPSELGKHTIPLVHESGGPMGRWEILPGRDGVTVAVGPVWEKWASPSSPGTFAALDRATRALALPHKPRAIEMEEWRLDMLPVPPTFDGGIVIGAAAGHRPRRPLDGQGALLRAGRIAGRAAAKAVHLEDAGAKALGGMMADEYLEIVAHVEAEIAHESHGLRRERAGRIIDAQTALRRSTMRIE